MRCDGRDKSGLHSFTQASRYLSVSTYMRPALQTLTYIQHTRPSLVPPDLGYGRRGSWSLIRPARANPSLYQEIDNGLLIGQVNQSIMSYVHPDLHTRGDRGVMEGRGRRGQFKIVGRWSIVPSISQSQARTAHSNSFVLS